MVDATALATKHLLGSGERLGVCLGSVFQGEDASHTATAVHYPAAPPHTTHTLNMCRFPPPSNPPFPTPTPTTINRDRSRSRSKSPRRAGGTEFITVFSSDPSQSAAAAAATGSRLAHGSSGNVGIVEALPDRPDPAMLGGIRPVAQEALQIQGLRCVSVLVGCNRWWRLSSPSAALLLSVVSVHSPHSPVFQQTPAPARTIHFPITPPHPTSTQPHLNTTQRTPQGPRRLAAETGSAAAPPAAAARAGSAARGCAAAAGAGGAGAAPAAAAAAAAVRIAWGVGGGAGGAAAGPGGEGGHAGACAAYCCTVCWGCFCWGRRSVQVHLFVLGFTLSAVLPRRSAIRPANHPPRPPSPRCAIHTGATHAATAAAGARTGSAAAAAGGASASMIVSAVTTAGSWRVAEAVAAAGQQRGRGAHQRWAGRRLGVAVRLVAG